MALDAEPKSVEKTRGMPEDFNQVLNLDNWSLDETLYEGGYYPEGSRDKMILISPVTAVDPFRPGWRYLFKKSRRWAPWQFWVEIMACRIGQIMQVPVPPAFPGFRTAPEPGEDPYGAVIEWFYSEKETYAMGALFLRGVIPDYDWKTGKQQNLMSILNLPLWANEINRRKVLAHWANVLTFDAVIGNTDRQPENWGVIVPSQEECSKNDSETINLRLSPAFDNGTGMGWEQLEENLYRFDDPAEVTRYLTNPKKARHHMKWAMDDAAPIGFFQFIAKLCAEYPWTREIVMNRLEFDEQTVRSKLEPLTMIPIAERWRLTNKRLEFTVSLVLRRRELLLEALGCK